MNPGDASAILLIADGDAPEARSAVAAAGGRLAARVTPAEAPARLAEPDALAGLVLMLDGKADADLLRRIEALARGDGLGAVIALPVELIDPVMAEISDPRIELLCVPTAAELAAAIGLIANRHAAAPADIALMFPERAETRGGVAEPGSRYRGEPSITPVAPETIRRVIRARRMRDRFFDPALFADPAWDMLLDLMAARLERRPVAVSSLCIAAAVPPTTALRWIRALDRQGVFLRTADPDDRRRMFVTLSDGAADMMAAYLADVRKLGLLGD